MKLVTFLTVFFLCYEFQPSSSSSCGELHNVTFPYHTPGPGPCERYGLDLLCDGNDTIVYFGSTKFLVKDLSIQNKTFRVVDPALAVESCSSVNRISQYYDTTIFDLLLPYNSWDSMVYLFNCTEEVKDSAYKLIKTCSTEPLSRVYAGFYIEVGEIPKSCSPVGSSFISFGGSPAENYLTNISATIDGAHVMELLMQGLVLSWNYTSKFYYEEQPELWDSKTCSVVELCWSDNSRSFKDAMRSNISTTGYKLLVFLSAEVSLLQCIYHYQPEYWMDAASSHVAFGFMLILFALLDIIFIVLVVRLMLLPLAIFSFLLHKYKRASLSFNSVEKFLRKHEMFSVKRYDFIEIAMMTNQFKEKLGQGGFGSVYKGKLFNGRQVAVKVLTNSLGDGDDFISEVATIGRIHHSNIVRLIGFCSEGSNRALVYPYMPNGSLDKYIFSANSNTLSVEKRRVIALGIARGIDYLHRGCEMQILHFDIKPHNILLDHDFTPKISDFGLAKLYTREYNLVTLSAARGTIGYIAPELVSRAFGVVSYKADVYSFGMLLMEMASRRRNVDNCVESSNQVYYPSWVYDQLKLKEEMCNSDYLNNVSIAQFGEAEGIMYKVALWCIQMTASNRPSMSRVIEMLQSDADSLEMPPRPFTTSSQHEFPVRCSQMDSCCIELSAISKEICML